MPECVLVRYLRCHYSSQAVCKICCYPALPRSQPNISRPVRGAERQNRERKRTKQKEREREKRTEENNDKQDHNTGRHHSTGTAKTDKRVNITEATTAEQGRERERERERER